MANATCATSGIASVEGQLKPCFERLRADQWLPPHGCHGCLTLLQHACSPR